jgi:alkaline phosphatase D
MDRRTFLSLAAALGATLGWARKAPAAARREWRERRDLYPQGVASGDPDEHSVLLWTRRPYEAGATRRPLHVEVALDPEFHSVVSTIRTTVCAEADWTCRVLVAGLKPRTVYWYRFTDRDGNGSRVGRTITAPAQSDQQPVRFAFVSCQSVNEGAQNAYRRMIWEDEHVSPDKKLDFVLHLGDFIYEVVEYPDEIQHRYDRTVYEVARIPDARKVSNFHVPTTLEGYRTVYRGHINDPDVQDARAYFPFVCIGDNHEFSWQGWQSFIKYGGPAEPAQQLRVAANQAWWEYIPARVKKASGAGLEKFDAPKVTNTPIASLDGDGFGDEINNRIAVGSMTGYRSMRFGPHVDLILTDFHSYAMEDPTSRSGADVFFDDAFAGLIPQEAHEILDAGSACNGGKPPADISYGAQKVPNFRKDEPPFTILGHVQKDWLKQQITSSKATWKIWGATNATLDARTDPQNLPPGVGKPWPGAGFATYGGGEFSSAFRERAEIYDTVRDAGVSGFVVVSGDRHSFWAGYAAKALPPARFEPVGIGFVTGSLSAIGNAEALEHGMKDHPLRPLFVVDREGAAPETTANLLFKRGVRTAWEYAQSGDLARARALTNPDVAPHLDFVDWGGHGYSVVTAAPDYIDTEFVCIPRPITRSATADGGPLRYRVAHRAERWSKGQRPTLKQTVLEGDPKLSI